VRFVLVVCVTLLGCHGAEAGYPTAEELAWDPELPQQDPSDPAVLPSGDGGWFELCRPSAETNGPATVACHDAAGNLTWRVEAPCCFGWASADGGTMAYDAGRLFVAQYSPARAGVVMFALDAAKGTILWPARLLSIAPGSDCVLDHSQHSQHVALKVVRGATVLYGNELDRGCIDVFSPEGDRLSRRLVSLASTR
jgi:hypothetical protein